MTSLLTTLNGFSFTRATPAETQTGGDLEYQAVFAASAVLFAGGVAAIMLALTQAI